MGRNVRRRWYGSLHLGRTDVDTRCRSARRGRIRSQSLPQLRLGRGRRIDQPVEQDRPESRDLFATKCAAFLKDGVCVTIVDVVTSYRANLFAGLLEELGWPEQTADDGIYVATLRGRRIGNTRRVNTWYYPLVVGAELPTLPLWIGDAVAVPLELEASYEDACRGVRIP